MLREIGTRRVIVKVDTHEGMFKLAKKRQIMSVYVTHGKFIMGVKSDTHQPQWQYQ